MLAGTVTLPSSEFSDIFARMKAGIDDSSLLLSSSVMQPVQRRLQQRSHIDLNAEYIERRFKVLMHMPALVRKRLSYLGAVGFKLLSGSVTFQGFTIFADT